MADQQQDPTQDRSMDRPAQGTESGREGASERMGKGGYGNDTGFTGGTVAPADDLADVQGAAHGGAPTGTQGGAGGGAGPDVPSGAAQGDGDDVAARQAGTERPTEGGGGRR